MAVVAVRLLVPLFEGALVQALQAEGADKMLGVELLGHGGDASTRDGLLAAGAERPPQSVIVGLAVGTGLVLKEVAAVELLAAFCAHEARWMPLTVES